jgi:hypothetical protein
MPGPALFGFLLIPALAAGMRASRGDKEKRADQRIAKAEKRKEKARVRAEKAKRSDQKNKRASRLTAEAKVLERKGRRRGSASR